MNLKENKWLSKLSTTKSKFLILAIFLCTGLLLSCRNCLSSLSDTTPSTSDQVTQKPPAEKVDVKRCGHYYTDTDYALSPGCQKIADEHEIQIAKALPYPYNLLGSSLDEFATQNNLKIEEGDPDIDEKNHSVYRTRAVTTKLPNNIPVEIGSHSFNEDSSYIRYVSVDTIPTKHHPKSSGEYDNLLLKMGINKNELRAKGFRVREVLASQLPTKNYYISDPKLDPDADYELEIDIGCSDGCTFSIAL